MPCIRQKTKAEFPTCHGHAPVSVKHLNPPNHLTIRSIPPTQQVVLHHTMIVADGMDASSMGGGGGSDMEPGGSSSGGGPGSGSSTEADDYATSLSLFLFWIGTKVRGR